MRPKYSRNASVLRDNNEIKYNKKNNKNTRNYNFMVNIFGCKQNMLYKVHTEL